MNRSTWKGPFVDPKLLKKVIKAAAADSTSPIKTWSRACTIIPDMVGRVISIHNGKAFVPIYIIPDMVGFRLGELVPTRIFKGHSGGDKTVGKGKKGGKK